MSCSFLKKINFKDKKTLAILISSAVLLLALAVVLVVVLINGIGAHKDGKAVNKILISDFPKLSYFVGEEADYTGLSIAVVYNNGKSDTVKYSEETKKDFAITGFDSKKAVEEQTITVRYGEHSCVYYITVKEVVKPAPVLIGISLEVMPKTEYKVGEWLDTEGGMIRREYSDGTASNTILIDQYVSGWDAVRDGGAGTYTLTVKYKEGGVLKTTTYEITVTE